MKIQEVFDRKVVRFQCEDASIYKNKKFLENLNMLFDHPAVRKNKAPRERAGHGTSTVGLESLQPLRFPESIPLKNWIDARIMESYIHFVDFIPSGIKYFRNWTNKIFKDAQVSVHDHAHKSVDGVGIFYVNLPDNGADLVFIKDGADLTTVDNYSPADIVQVNARDGELVLHDPTILHTTTKHNNEEPRICIVIEFEYIP
jgi:hypothetical protein